MSVIDLEEWRKKLEKASPSRSRLQQTMWSEQTGRKPTNSNGFHELELTGEDIKTLIAFVVVLDRAHLSPFTLQSDFAREASQYVAICASEGLITVRIEEDASGAHEWHMRRPSAWRRRWLLWKEFRQRVHGEKAYCS